MKTNDDHVSFPVDEAMAFAMGSASHGGIREVLRTVDAAEERRVHDAIAEAPAERADAGVVRLSRGALVVVATA